LRQPFIVLATQNPIEFEGVFPLPEAQLDRFLMRLRVGYPEMEEETTMLRRLQREHPIASLAQVADGQDLPELTRLVWDVHVDETLNRYVVQLIHATRQHSDLALGASPRGSLALFKTSQALAAVRGRDYVLPEDIKTMAPLTLTHRLLLQPESALRGRTAEAIVHELLEQVELPLST
jgi:MoxR-like ATPase